MQVDGGVNMIVGICGKSGSGKSTLAKQFINIYDEATYCDIDKIGHKVLTIAEVKQELINCFGNEIINNDNIDRKYLGNIVFNSRERMDKLSDITWKYMQIEIDKFLNENKNKIIILDWILLPISKYFDICDLKILLDIPYSIRKERAMKRDNIKEDAFALREKASINYDNFKFDFIIKDNDIEKIKRLVKLI